LHKIDIIISSCTTNAETEIWHENICSKNFIY